MEIKAELFLASPTDGADGEWVELPMEEDKLKERIESLSFEEFIISCHNTELPLRITEFSSVLEINKTLLKLEKYSRKGKLDLFLTILMYHNGNMEYAERHLEQGNYEFFTEVEDEESLGEAVAKSGKIGYIPERLKPYIDYEKIGRDWFCNGTRIYSKTRTAFRETNPDHEKSGKRGH